MPKEPTDKEIDKLIDEVSELQHQNKNPFHGMSYLEGIRDTLDWIRGDGEYPLSD